MERVIEKLKTDDSALKMITDYLISFCEKEPNFTDKVLNENKSLSDCLDYIKSEAKKTVVAGVSVVDDATVFGWAVHYFDEENLKWKKTTANVSTSKKTDDEEDCDLDCEEEKPKKVKLAKRKEPIKKKIPTKNELLAAFRKESKVAEGQVSLF